MALQQGDHQCRPALAPGCRSPDRRRRCLDLPDTLGPGTGASLRRLCGMVFRHLPKGRNATVSNQPRNLQRAKEMSVRHGRPTQLSGAFLPASAENGRKPRRELLAHPAAVTDSNFDEKLIVETRQEAAAWGRSAIVEDELGYFVNNVQRMQYGTFRRQGFFIGSGVIEAGCKTVIGSRCKQSGMFWGEPGAENVLALRCIHTSRRLDEFWKHRLNDHAARNDSLPLAA